MLALRIRVSISAIGSVITITTLPPSLTGVYQLAFLTPGICPLWASSRKQIRHNWNLRITECGRPQRLQRVYSRTLNFCGRCCLAIIDFLATNLPPYGSSRPTFEMACLTEPKVRELLHLCLTLLQ